MAWRTAADADVMPMQSERRWGWDGRMKGSGADREKRCVDSHPRCQPLTIVTYHSPVRRHVLASVPVTTCTISPATRSWASDAG